MSSREQERAPLKPPLSLELRLARYATVLGLLSLMTAVGLRFLPVLFGVADKSGAFKLWTIILGVAGALLGGTGKSVEWLEKKARARRDWNDVVLPLLRLPAYSGRLSRLDEIRDINLGPTPTRYTAAGDDKYVPREVRDDELRDEMNLTKPPFPFLLLRGDSKAGKSRTMLEAARHVWPTSTIVAPLNGEAAAKLSRLESFVKLVTPPALVWLDDITAADLDHLTPAVLDMWSQRALVVGTMTNPRYDETLRTGSEIGATARSALNRARVFELSFELTDAERSIAQQTYPQENFSPVDGRPVSIGETLVGGEELLRKLHAGRADCPAGQAVSRAAIDIYRAGIRRPIGTGELKRLFPHYLRQVKAGIEPSEEQFAIGLEWASRPIASQAAIISQVANGKWEVYLNYLVEAESGEYNHLPRPIPDFLWLELLDMTAASEAFAIGWAARWANQTPVAVKAMRRALNCKSTASKAALFLGDILATQGEFDEARRNFQLAIDSGDDRVTPVANYLLGVLSAKHDDSDSSIAAFQRAIASGHVECAPRAAYMLGQLRERHRDVAGATIAFKQAMESNHEDWAPTAAAALLKLTLEHGDPTGVQGLALQYMTAAGRCVIEAPGLDEYPGL